jgi:hypothetical protein
MNLLSGHHCKLSEWKLLKENKENISRISKIFFKESGHEAGSVEL